MNQLLPTVNPVILQYDSLLKAGKTYITKANIQQLVWLALELGYKYEFISVTKLDELATVGAVGYSELTFVIIDASGISSKIPAGFTVDSNWQSVCIITGNENIESLVNNQSVSYINLDLADGLNFKAIEKAYSVANIASRDLKLRENIGYPSSLLRRLSKGNTEFIFRDEEEPIYNEMLKAVLQKETIIEQWVNISKSKAMRMFKHSNCFLTFLSRNETRGACRGLAPLLQPFVLAFKQEYRVEYLQLAGSWLLYSATVWADKNKTGVRAFRSGYYCDFSPQALNCWQELIKSFN